MDRRAPIDRRRFLETCGGGLGGIALAQLLGRAGALRAALPGSDGAPDLNGGLHHRAKARRVVQLFMNGGASPVDTFDPKPRLAELDGQTFDPGGGALVESVTNSPGFKLMKSPFRFAQHGECGRWVSEVFPNLARRVDDLAFLMSMTSKTNVHGPASYLQNTGFVRPGFPAMGAWVSYALGSLADDLPTFVVLPDPRGLPYNNQGNFGAAFLPAKHAGTILKPHLKQPIADLLPPESPSVTPGGERANLELLDRLNRRHLEQHPGDSRLDARIAAYELAARMQLSAPDVLDLGNESKATRDLYGADEEPTAAFGRNCLVARRLLERGVRFVQLWSGAAGNVGNWDNHADIRRELPPMAAQTDRPIAGLLEDLKSRGLLADTLVIWTTEFGRMPFSQGTAGRDHNGGTFVSWLAGAGIKPGVAFGESDEWGWKALVPTWGYDLHATVLHLLGIDHERLTIRHDGADRRLTDVHGHVIEAVLS